jgi:regulator of sigma E protease
VLDGGHVFLLLIEKIRGKPPGEKFLVAYQLCGLVFLVLLVVYATYNDIGRLISRRF